MASCICFQTQALLLPKGSCKFNLVIKLISNLFTGQVSRTVLMMVKDLISTEIGQYSNDGRGGLIRQPGDAAINLVHAFFH